MDDAPDRGMTPARWSRVRQLFGEALQLEGEEQARYLDGACRDDSDLRDEIEELLSASAEAGSFLGAPRSDDESDAFVGRELDSYRLVRRIGQGGMGAVYLGLRADQEFKRRVAVKLMARHISGEEAMVRFRTERQILAGLDHPHIAKLLDGGTTPEGLPYLVMEYVEGQPIDEYCMSRELSIRQRLRLFLALCSAVQFAHRNLVVHRDLKPTNVLVDGHGHLKLLDFGIAKLLNPELSPQGLAPTVSSLQALTPEYASPEQIQGEPVNTASDVYSLGVVLYLLLTGSLPYEVGRSAPAAMIHAICTDPPRRASEAADPSLGRRLRGDLDNILQKALRKEPPRRYESVEQLADDVRNYLDGRPVGARAATWHYRLGKFLRRHPWGAVATALLVVSSLTFGWLMSAKNAELQRQRDLAEQSKDLLADLFQGLDPMGLSGGEPTLRQVLDQGTARLEEGRDVRPEVRSELLGLLGGVYRNLGDIDHSIRLLEEALHVGSTFDEESSEAMGALRNSLADAKAQAGDFDAAAELYGQTLALRDERDDVAATAMDGLGTVLHHQRDLTAAETLYLEALELQREIHGAWHPKVATTLNNLAALRFSQRNLPEAETLFRQVLDYRQRTFGNRHAETAQSVSDLATVLRLMGRREESLKLFEQAVDVRRDLLGDDHPRLASTLNNLAGLHEELGDDERAERTYREALAIYRASLGESHHLVAGAMNNLANVLRRTDRLAEARDLSQSALDGFRSALGDEHPNTAIVGINLASVEILLGADLARAEELLTRALPLLRETLPAKYAFALVHLAQVELATDRAADAETHAREALAVLEGITPREEWRVEAARSVLAECLAARGETAEAAEMLRRAITALESADAAQAREFLPAARTNLAALGV